MLSYKILSRLCLILLFLLVPGGQPAAQNLLKGFPFVTNYLPEQYHGYSQNWSIDFDKNGYVFVANGDGVLHYDGIEWRKILLDGNMMASCVRVDRNNTVWVGGKAEIGYLMPDKSKGYVYKSLMSKMPLGEKINSFIIRIVPTKYGIYFYESGRIFRYFNDKVSTIPLKRAGFLLEYKGVPVVFQSGEGLYILSGEKLLKIIGSEVIADGMPRTLLSWHGDSILIADRKLGLWKGTLDLNHMIDARASLHPIYSEASDFVRSYQFVHATKLTQGYAFASTNAGTLVTDQNLNVRIILNRRIKIINETHNYLKEDAQGNLWIAMDYSIAKVNLQSPFTYFDIQAGIKGSVQYITRFYNQLYLATWQGVYREKKHVQEMLVNQAEKEDIVPIFERASTIKTIAWDLQKQTIGLDTFLLCSTSDGLIAFDKNGKEKQLLNTSVKAVQKTQMYNNEILFGTDNALIWAKLGPGCRILDTMRISVDLPNISAIIADGPGSYYISCEFRGVCHLSTSEKKGSRHPAYSYHYINSRNGLDYSEYNIIHQHQDDKLVLNFHGLYEIVGNDSAITFNPFFEKYFQKTYYINVMSVDDPEGIWFQVNSKVTGGKSVFFAKKTYKGYKEIFAPFQNLPSYEIYYIYHEPGNFIWFATDEGIFRFDKARLNDTVRPFATHLRKILVGKDSVIYAGERYSNIAAAQLPYYYNTLLFYFSSNDLSSENAISYSYYLEGFDKDWSVWSNTHYKEYTNLSPGKYIFHVRSRNQSGMIGKEDSYEFIIKSPWYITFWAIAGYIILAFLLVSGIVMYSNKRLIRAKQRLENIIHQRTLEIQNKSKEIESEKEKSDRLLLNILPVRVAEQLKTQGKCPAEFFQSTTVLFTDFSGFTKIAEHGDPEDIVEALHYIFGKFDEICTRNKLEKIKTIGDSHMSVAGIPVRNKTHFIDACMAAIEMQNFMRKYRMEDPSHEKWLLRIGIHTGELIAGVVGKRKFAFDVWGDTVNIASRLQDAGMINRINISRETKELVESFFETEYRGEFPIKHKGPFPMYFLNRLKPEFSNDEFGLKPNVTFWNEYIKLSENKFLKF